MLTTTRCFTWHAAARTGVSSIVLDLMPEAVELRHSPGATRPSSGCPTTVVVPETQMGELIRRVEDRRLMARTQRSTNAVTMRRENSSIAAGARTFARAPATSPSLVVRPLSLADTARMRR